MAFEKIGLQEGFKFYQGLRKTQSVIMLGPPNNVHISVVSNRGRFKKLGWHICHSILDGYAKVSGRVKYIGAYLGYSDIKPFNEAHKKFWDWMLTDGPFAGVYLNKSSDSAYRNGLWVDADNDRRLVTFASIASRVSTEKFFAVNLWHKMVVYGIDPLLAMFMCLGTLQVSSSQQGLRISINTVETHKCVYSGRISWDRFRQIKSGKLVIPKKNFLGFTINNNYSKYGCYGELRKLWGVLEPAERPITEDFKKALVKPSTKTVGNIFASTSDNVYDEEELETVMKNLKKLQEEKLNG